MYSFQDERTDEEVQDLMFELIKKRHTLIHKNFLTVSKYERPERVPDIPPMPAELFRQDSADESRNLFYKGLNRGDVLYFQVVNSLPDSYKLWVLAKHNVCTKIEELGLVMHLPKLLPELKLLGEELKIGDFIKAALCSCSLHERKLFVTLDETLFTTLAENVETVKLGKITHHDLPYYVGSFKNTLSYVGYIHRSEAFYNPGWCKQMCEVLGLKRNYIYSFFDGWEGKTYPAHEYASELVTKQRLMQSVKYYNQAVASYEEKKIEETFNFLNKALMLNPDNVQALTTRGTVHANENCLRKAFIDTEAALKLNPTFQPAKKQMSKLLIALARTHLEQHNYIKAQESLKMSSALDGDNVELTKPLLDLIPTKVRNLNRQTDDSSVFRVPRSGSSKEHRKSGESSSHSKKKDKKHHKKRSRHHHSRSRRHHSKSSISRPLSPRSSGAESAAGKKTAPSE